MQFCPNCGTQLPDGSRFCAACGATVSQQQDYNQQYYAQPNYNQQQNYYQQNYSSGYQGTAPIPEENSTPDPNDVTANKVYGVLSYLGLLILIPLLSEKGKASPFARFHANQGLYFLVIELIITIVTSTLSGFTGLLIFKIISSVFSIAFMVIQIIGIVNAAQGTLKPLPLINDIIKAIKK